MGTNLLGAVLSAVVGGAMAAATIVGLVSAQTSGPEQNPVNAEKPIINYGK